MNIDQLTIGEAKQLAAMFAPQYQPATTTPTPHYNGEFRIMVLQSGWVYVGTLRTGPDGHIDMPDARNIRQYGTTQGLGQLKDGPTKNTILEPPCHIIIPPASVVHSIPTEKSKWP